MKKIASLFLSFALLLNMSGCGTAHVSNTANPEFTEFLEDFVVELCENDYTTMHRYFERPEKYGVDPAKAEITLGNFENEEDESNIDRRFNEFEIDTLDASQQNIYNHLLFDAEYSDEDFDYLESIWGSTSGIHQVLVQFFGEYELYKEADIAPLLKLIHDVPRFTKDALKYSKKQAKAGTLMLDYDGVMEDCQNVLDSKMDSAITSHLFEELDRLQLEDADTYKQEIQTALEDDFFPSYQTMMDGLESLKSDIQPLQGISHFKNGRKYYRSLVHDATGSDDTIRQIKRNLNKDIDEKFEQMANLMMEDEDVLEQMHALKTPFQSIDELLNFLENSYASEFPEIDAIDYETIPLAQEQSQPGIMAYFLLPAIDFSNPYRIRYNEIDHGNDPSSLMLYITLAHEGLPGHMYQFEYNHEHFKYPIQYFLNNLGFTEGYATYVEMECLNFLDLEDSVKQAYILNTAISNNYIALMDISIHYDGLSYSQFQEQYEDVFGSNLRDLYDQLADNPASFLSYYYGYYQIQELKEKAQDALQEDFDVKEFHEALLQSGSVPFDQVEKNIDSYIQKKR